MADKLDGQRHLARRIARKDKRRCRSKNPARGGRAGEGRGPVAQDERGHARFFGRQDQLAAHREVERLRISPRLDHNCPCTHGPQYVCPGTQRRERVRSCDQDDPGRIDPQFHHACRIKPAMLALPLVFADPEDRAGFAGAGGQHQREPAGSGMILGFSSAEFMERTTRQPTPKPRIDGCTAKGKKRSSYTGAGSLQTFETALQLREQGRRIRHNVPIMF